MAEDRIEAARRSTGGRRRRGMVVALAVLALGAIALALATLDANWRFARRLPPPSVRLLSAPFPLRPGVPATTADLEERLTRLGYRRVPKQPRDPGDFSERFRGLEIALHGRAGAPAPVVRVRLGSGVIRSVEDRGSGEEHDGESLEPEFLGILSGGEREERVPVTLAQIPASLKDAVIAVEDRRFLRHPGFDLIGIVRAAFANLRHGEVVQGGSTITQQLAKMLYEGQDTRTFAHKAWETLAAVGLEMAQTKDAILERYLNEVYLAQRGPDAIIGVGAASRHFFGKDVSSLDLEEAALLAGLIQSPGHYHPYRHPDAARQRRDLVLGLMRDEGLITPAQERTARSAPLRLRAEESRDPRQAPYFTDYVSEELQRLGWAGDGSADLEVTTTLDPLLQARAEEALESRLSEFERSYRILRPMPSGPLQGALVALRPEDGSIIAMVGGRDYRASQFNRAVQAHRQPGSLFKPFVYLAGFSRSQRDQDDRFTAATVLDDSPLDMEVAGRTWSPRDYDGQFRGPVTARQALANSLNVPTVRAAQAIGLDEVVRQARRCGITSPLEPVPSIALGTFEVSPLEIAAAFTSLANLGRRAEPRAVIAAVDGRGRRRQAPVPVLTGAASSQAAYLTVDLMRDVLRYGTAASSANWNLEGDFAGKTGTTDEGRDAWFVGFSPDLLILAWVGFDDNRPLRMGGATLALPIWGDVMRRAPHDPAARWEEPDGFVRASVDPTTGKLAGWRCSDEQEEMFIGGTAPQEECEHDGPSESWARRFFHWFRRD